ncbi:hypothetical protein D9619_011332 [Psilocybe cf. subviscida]|uniref:Uncharacterized protein n=1 Tax=Psilocybe cf. subviscida TaxID=2480587 RepID=A0A8H5BJJ8_9AGAR|nr:hypothetical protein D9619_011332 [Psilocybe cf. subviscida]
MQLSFIASILVCAAMLVSAAPVPERLPVQEIDIVTLPSSSWMATLSKELVLESEVIDFGGIIKPTISPLLGSPRSSTQTLQTYSPQAFTVPAPPPFYPIAASQNTPLSDLCFISSWTRLDARQL